MCGVGKAFCKDIGEVVFARYVLELDQFSFDVLADRVNLDVDVLGALMRLLGFRGSDRTLVVAENGEWVFEGDANLVKELLDPKRVK